MKCINTVGDIDCQHCQGPTIKFGRRGVIQRYRCKNCKKLQLKNYEKQAWKANINAEIATHVKEGCGIRGISRLLQISATTVISRIQKIAENIKKPAIPTGRTYEVDELKTYIKTKTSECWVIYALDRESGQVVDFKAGSRNKKNLKRVTETLLLAGCKQICTDRLDIYRFVIPEKIHRVKRYGTNRIERKNLSLRTHLKPLGRKTICFSKTLLMLEACLRIYFWYKEAAGC